MRRGVAKVKNSARVVIGAANVFPFVAGYDLSLETTMRGDGGRDFSL